MDEAAAPKRKQPSGYQNRLKRKQREMASQRATDEDNGIGNSWGSSLAAANQFDPNGPAVELPVFGRSPPTVLNAVTSAILELEQGKFTLADYLWDGMTRDDRLAATLDFRCNRLVGSELSITPSVDPSGSADGPDEVVDGLNTATAQQAADQWKKIAASAMPAHQVYRLLQRGLGMSVSIAQRLTLRAVKSSMPTFRVWNNRTLRWDWMTRRYMLVTENRGEIPIEAGDPEWIVYEPYGPMGWLNGALLRAISVPWFIRYFTRVWWSRFQETHGQPLRLGIIPAQRDPKDEKLFLSQLKNIGHEAVIRLAQGTEDNRFDVKLLEAQGNNWEGFQRLLDHCDDSFAILIIGQRQSTKGQGGLGSQAEAGEATMMRITRKDALIGDVLREQHVEPWALDMFGDEEYAPKIGWQIDPPEDEAKTASTDLNVAQALVQFKNSGAPINVREYLSQRGYPLLTVEEEAAQKAEAEAKQQAEADLQAAKLEEAQALSDRNYVEAGMLMPEEAALRRFGKEDGFDAEARRRALAIDDAPKKK